MREEDWLTSDDWQAMLAFLRGRWTERKATLYVCAGLRHLWDLLYDDGSRLAVEVAEKAADGPASEDDIAYAKWHAECPTFGFDFEPGRVRADLASGWDSNPQALMARGVYQEEDLQRDDLLGEERTRGRLLNAANIAYRAPSHVNSTGELDEHLLWYLVRQEEWPGAWLVREIAGNPFRPITPDPTWMSWNGGTIPKLAQAIYEERSFDRLPVLGDALEEAGCGIAEWVDHCRTPGPHFRGCWAVDLALART
jgi:hypothetical protein